MKLMGILKIFIKKMERRRKEWEKRKEKKKREVKE